MRHSREENLPTLGSNYFLFYSFSGSKPANDAASANDHQSARKLESTKQHATTTTDTKHAKSITKHSTNGNSTAHTEPTEPNDSNTSAPIITTTTGTFSIRCQVLRQKRKTLRKSMLKFDLGRTRIEWAR